MPEDDKKIRTLERREARSGRLDYGDPITLHESSKQRIAAVAFFIPRTEGTQVSVKIIQYERSKNFIGQIIEEEKQAISLQAAAAKELLVSLQQMDALVERGTTGKYLVVPVGEGSIDIGAHAPATVASTLLRLLGKPDLARHLADVSLDGDLIRNLRSAMHLGEMRAATERLRDFLDEEQVEEAVYQDWCEEHSWAFGNAYVMRDDVRNISAGDMIDLLLPRIISGYRDIVELKRPDMAVLRFDKAHRNYYFSSEVSKAIGQCHRYMDVLHEEARGGLRDHPEVVAYHPRAIIVIGRSFDWEAEKIRSLVGLNHRLSGITVMTYDQLLAQALRLTDILGEAGKNAPREDAEDGDLPF